MKAFVVAYCFGGAFGQTLIGVYKRALRVAHALCDRGHSVAFYCAGRENYHDEMTASAEARMDFVDWPWRRPLHEGARENRRHTLAALRAASPDVVLIGEAPLAGPLLEVTLAAAELGVPVVCLDNAYGGRAVEEFCRRHGPMYDGLVLTGPRSFQAAAGPPYLLQVPPYIEASEEGARALVAELGLGGRPLVTVLAYDANVEALGLSLLARLDRPDVAALFLTHVPDACAERVGRLPADVRARVRVGRPLADPLHFGILRESRLVVGKCAFMQVTECLTLRTPIVGFHFQGDFHLGLIPEVCRPFAHQTPDAGADDETVARARRFLDLAPDEMLAVHDGGLGAAARTVAFLESLPRAPRTGTLAECAADGIDPEAIGRAIAALEPGAQLSGLRATRLREPRGQRLDAVLARGRVDGRDVVHRLWLRRFDDDDAFERERAQAEDPAAGRRVLHGSRAGRLLVEADIGEAALPEIGDA